jgi:hypothetical protein
MGYVAGRSQETTARSPSGWTEAKAMRTSAVQPKVASPWGAIRDLYHRLLSHLYKSEDTRRARLVANRLEPLLATADPNGEAIFGEECRSLIHEARRNFRQAIKHRKNEIRLIRKLHGISRDKPYEQVATQGYTYDDLADRLNLLAALYHDSGSFGQALKTLEQSRLFCAEHAIEFGASEMLEKYIAEKEKRQRRLKKD